MTYNYHAHTARCGHASGTPEEYVQRAIACGICEMGFSDHFPYTCLDGCEPGYCVPVAQAKDYVKEIADLREKYRDRIALSVGFEMEYYADRFELMLQNAIDYGAEYLILGEHFVKDEHPNVRHTLKPTDDVAFLQDYVQAVCAAIRTGAFTYVAHPDIVGFTGDDAVYEAEMRKICEASLECNVPLEINFLGIRDKRTYPRMAFWRIAGAVGCPVTFGFDAHDTQNAYDGASLTVAQEMVRTYGLHYIGKPTLRPLTNREGK